MRIRTGSGFAALAASILLARFGYQANQQSRLVVIANGKMIEIPMDDDMLREEELAWGPGGFLSGTPGAAEHLEALRRGNRAYKMQYLYFGGSAFAALAGVGILLGGRKSKRTAPE